MNAVVADLMKILEAIAPASLAEEWDNPGLQVGSVKWPVTRVWVALDPLPQVIAAACRQGVDLLVTHHPLIFRPLQRIDAATALGQTVADALAHRLTIVAAHTNLDTAAGGLNDLLAARIGLENTAALDPGPEDGTGLGRIGDVVPPVSLPDFVRRIKERLGVSAVRVAGDPGGDITRAAVCTGSGGSLMSAFFASGAQAFVSGDLRYHDARDAESAGRVLIDIGHFGSEHFMVDALAALMKEGVDRRRLPVAVEACRIESDPFRRL